MMRNKNLIDLFVCIMVITHLIVLYLLFDEINQLKTNVNLLQKDMAQMQHVQNELFKTNQTLGLSGKDFTVTAYCSCKECCGIWYKEGAPVTGTGLVELQEGVHAASNLPDGTKVYIEGLGLREIQDTPARHIVERYNHKIIDLYFADHQAAKDFGKNTYKVWILQ